MSRIKLKSGRLFDFARPDATPLQIEDIAWALARERRYSNQSPLAITVAQHSCDAVMLDFVQKHSREVQRGILLHDASEAVMRDIAAPLKALLPDYRALEKKIQASILRGLGVTPAPPSLIERVDAELREWEMGRLWDPSPCHLYQIWGEDRARSEFLYLWGTLR
jgi:hypothetical protein